MIIFLLAVAIFIGIRLDQKAEAEILNKEPEFHPDFKSKVRNLSGATYQEKNDYIKEALAEKNALRERLKEISNKPNSLEPWFSSMPQLEIDGLGERINKNIVKVTELRPVKLSA